MRNRFKWAGRFILAVFLASLVSCQSGGGSGASSPSKENITDPNTSFSDPATRAE